jgi:hypothetical protein
MVGTQSSGIGTSNRAGMANTLQRQAGNIRLGRMAGTVQRKTTGAGSKSYPTIQFQLLVNQPGDAAEQEADCGTDGKQAPPTLQRQAASAERQSVTPEIYNTINASRAMVSRLATLFVHQWLEWTQISAESRCILAQQPIISTVLLMRAPSRREGYLFQAG